MNEKIQSFWDWFSQHSSQLTPETITDEIVGEFERILFAIHKLDWEIGPGKKSANCFSLSPTGDKSLLALTQSIISKAPPIKEWEFSPAKPKRDWNIVFNLSVGDREITIDGKPREFIIINNSDDTFNVLFKPSSGLGLSYDYLSWAATIILDGEIGEARRIKLIKDVKVVATWDIFW